MRATLLQSGLFQQHIYGIYCWNPPARMLFKTFWFIQRFTTFFLSLPSHLSATAVAAGCQSQRGGVPPGRDGELHGDAAAAGRCCRYRDTVWVNSQRFAQKNPPFLFHNFIDQVTLNWWACCWSGEQTPWWEPCTVMASRRHRRETWTPTAWQQLTDTGG